MYMFVLGLPKNHQVHKSRDSSGRICKSGVESDGEFLYGIDCVKMGSREGTC